MTEDRPAPVPPGGRVPASRYRSRAFWELEWHRLWTRVWLLAGHVGRLAAPGDYFTLEVGPESLLVVRGEDGKVRAFYNVCQHRGNVLCPAESGRAASFKCSYHHWCYRLDGALSHAPLREHPEGEIQLAEIPCAVRLGFVWISMSPEPEPIDAFLAPVAPAIAAYRPERFTPRDETTVAVACNWKTSVDVNNESYHLRSLHPELMEWIDDAAVREELLGRHSSIHVPLRGAPANAARARAQAAAEGIDLSALPDEALVEKRQFHVFPNVQLNFTARSLEIYRHRPSGSDPLATLFDEQSYDLLPPGVAARPRRARRVEHGKASLGPVMDADVDLLPLLTRGMASRGFPGLCLGAREECIANMHRAIDGYLFPAEAPDAQR